MIYLSDYGLMNLSLRKVESSSHNIGRIVELVLTHTYSSTSKWRCLVPYIIITRYSRTVSNVRTPPGAKKPGFRKIMSRENYVRNCPKETVAVGVEAQELATQTTLHHTTGFLPDYQLDTTIDNSSYSAIKADSVKQVPQIEVEDDLQQWSLLLRLEVELKSAPPILQQLEPQQLQQLLSLLRSSIKMKVSQ